MNFTTQMIHPMLVHFPIALILVGFLFATVTLFCGKCCKKCATDSDHSKYSVSCLEKVGFYLLTLGSLSAVAALIAGYVFTEEMVGVMGSMRDTHSSVAIAAMVVSLIACAVYAYYIYSAKKVRQVLYIGYVLYLIAAVLIGITGHLGGEMVFGV